MNLLFALHHSFWCNSASHVDGLARQFSSMGWNCLVAVPDRPEDISRFAPVPYQTATFAEVLDQPNFFPNGRGPDVFHAWTPRECVRKFNVELQNRIPEQPFATIIHLEDNEEHIALSEMGQQDFEEALQGTFPREYPNHLTHPLRQREFFERASGATVLIDRLAEHVPCSVPTTTFWPAADQSIWSPRPRNDQLREELGIRPEEIVLTYHGNAHATNFPEVRSLYLATALLNRQGCPTRLVRVGTDSVETDDEYRNWADSFSIELGYVMDRQRLADILAIADVFVQPGRSDRFNDYRFPSKLPEFFAMGKPVVLPRTNIGLVTRHLQDAYVLERADGIGIAKAVQTLVADPALMARLATGAVEFSRSQFSWQKAAGDIQKLYTLAFEGEHSTRLTNLPTETARKISS